ncbi:MAG: DUF2480 family protein [Bacteroidia bacterium]
MIETEFEIKNKVAESGLITIDLETFYHNGELVLFDIKPWLFREMILKEKDFREQVKTHNWQQYTGKNIAFTCTADAIVPTWAYMLLGIAVKPYANRFVFGNLETLESILFIDALSKINPKDYIDKRVIIKGCGNVPITPFAYVELTNLLLPYAKTVMYGEACSNVPLFKKK